MSLILIIFGMIVLFHFEKLKKLYVKYVAVSITKEKSVSMRKLVNANQQSWVKERNC